MTTTKKRKHKLITYYIRTKEFLLGCPFKTIYVNFRLLPFKTAIRLPIFIHSYTELRNLTGKVHIDTPYIYPGMIAIGRMGRYVQTCRPMSVLNIAGTVVFKGRVSFFGSSYVMVAANGVLTIGTNGTFFGTNSKIMCFESITIGDRVRMAWNVQIFDSSFHYVDTGTGDINKLTAPLTVGYDCWISNSVTLAKGTVLPSNSIVASGSYVNKDMTEYGSGCLMAGVPAKVKKTGVYRIFDEKQERELDKKFGYSRTHL